jgi:DMSO/TMAO reductase YedYZ molybdopterin-dependent catalytic subunit
VGQVGRIPVTRFALRNTCDAPDPRDPPDQPDPPDPPDLRLTRRDFLAASLLVPAFARQTSEARLLGTVPLGNPGGTPTAPLERLVGSGLDARLFTNLSTIDRRDPSTLITSNDRFYIRSAAPPSPGEKPAGFEAELQRSARRVGPYVMECAGNADPANFGLISAATWEGVPMNAMLDRMRAPANVRVLVSGTDHPGPSRTSVPGASWIFTRDQLDRALLASRMNDAPLPPHHGSPIRLVIPGWYGCACIKWVNLIEIVSDDAPATTQMREFAARTHQDGEPRLARDYAAATIDTAAIPVRVEKWIAGGRIEYRVTGIQWGGSKPTNALSIRFRAGGPWVKIDDCPVPESTFTWTVWTHTWRPTEPGRYQIVLRVDDPSIRTRRLDLFYYVREMEITEV